MVRPSVFFRVHLAVASRSNIPTTWSHLLLGADPTLPINRSISGTIQQAQPYRAACFNQTLNGTVTQHTRQPDDTEVILEPTLSVASHSNIGWSNASTESSG
jgi:hypothetical protein